ncbi:MAG: ATP synthase F1 subunit delta [Acidobacteriota bacterium]|nr:ATP synthase F1 subunit delta [Acidobacteriota bacterium]
MVSVVAARYARALADVILDGRGRIEPGAAVEQLRSVERMFAESEDLRQAMLTPAIQASRKRAVMATLAGQLGVANEIKNFLFVLIDHRRIGMISEMREAFELEIDQRMGVARTQVTSAEKLGDGERSALESELVRLTGKQVRVQYAVDPELLGGAVARVGSVVYDGSLRGQLGRLRRQLTQGVAAYKAEI